MQQDNRAFGHHMNARQVERIEYGTERRTHPISQIGALGAIDHLSDRRDREYPRRGPDDESSQLLVDHRALQALQTLVQYL
jgi:hypothetical protein